MIQLEKEELERQLDEGERERGEGEARLTEVKEEVEAVLGEVEESSEKISRLEEGLLPLATNLNAKKVQLGKLEAEVQERQQVLKGVEQKIETSQKILS